MLGSTALACAAVAGSLLGAAATAVPHHRPLPWRASMVHKNPGEGLTDTKYSDPSVVQDLGFNVMVKQDGRPPSTAITWDTFDPTIFSPGSAGRAWVEDLGAVIDENIKSIHDSGMKALYWFDMFVLPSALANKYHNDIINSQGQWSLDSPQMANITLYMLDAVFQRFPDLDGLVIRTGEVYTQDVPYHQGGSVITNAYHSHIQLIQLLEEVVIKKYNKILWYRTWAFDGFTTDPVYYLNVTNAFKPQENLKFVIKHTSGDFWRTLPFNPTLGLGKHDYLIEVECQREYEAKGATPDYVMDGVINGFEEERKTPGKHGIRELTHDPKLQGILAWPRGGGWGGPYPADEFWIDLNVNVIVNWALKPWESEIQLFQDYVTRKLRLDRASAAILRQVAELSASGVLYGHYSVVHELTALFWTRDDTIGGYENWLKTDADAIVQQKQVAPVLAEKRRAQGIWREIEALAGRIRFRDRGTSDFVRYSAEYGRLLYDIIAESWVVQFTGLASNATGTITRNNVRTIRAAVAAYDKAWTQYNGLTKLNKTGQISSLYKPDLVNGSVNVWRDVQAT